MSDYDDMQWSVRVSASGPRRASVYARKSKFEVGPPLAFDVEDERTSAFEMLLGAVGADLAVGMKQACQRQRLDVSSVEALVVGKLDNALTHLGVVGEEGHPGLDGIAIKVFVETLEEEADIEKVWERVLERSPMYRTFSPIGRLDVQLKIVM